jgi:hypothetical protein
LAFSFFSFLEKPFHVTKGESFSVFKEALVVGVEDKCSETLKSTWLFKVPPKGLVPIKSSSSARVLLLLLLLFFFFCGAGV